VAGVAALLLDAEGTLDARDVKDAMTQSAVPLRGTEPNTETGYGLVNATAAIDATREATGGGGEGNISIEQVPGSTSSNLRNTTKHVSIRADTNLTIANGTNYRFNFTNEDTGNRVVLEANGSGLVPADDDGLIQFGLYSPDGSVSSHPRIIAHPNVGNVEARVVGGSIPAASGVTNFSVALVNASDGSTIDTTESAPSVIGYRGVLSQKGTSDTVRLSIPRDVLPRSADVTLGLRERATGDLSTLQMSYDATNDTFATTLDTSNFTAGNYSWGVRVRSQNVLILRVGGDRSAKKNVTLRTPVVEIAGQVRNASGDPAVNDTVLIYTRERSDGPLPGLSFVEQALTNETGNFSVAAPENAEYNLAYVQGSLAGGDLLPRDGSPDIYGLTQVTVGESAVSLSPFQLETGHDLNVSVVDASDDPVENASVVYFHAGGESYGSSAVGAIEALTNADGLVDLSGLENVSRTVPGLEVTGNVTVFVRPPEDERFADRTYERNVTGDDRITVALTERHTVSGTVENATNDPINGSFVVARGPTFEVDETNRSGTFELDVRGKEDYSLGFVQQDAAGIFAPRDGTVDLYEFRTVNTSTDLDVGTVTIPDGHVLNVSVVDASGDPVENATVTIRHHNDTSDLRSVELADILTNPDGLIQLDPTPPGIEVLGNVSVTVTPPENDSRFRGGTYERNVTVTTDDRITVTLSGTCVADAVSGSNDEISLQEIQKAIDRWATDAEVPGTGGETISLSGIQGLIDAWAKGTLVSCS